MDERRDRLRALGELLRRLRREAGLTGKDLAVRAQVAQPMYTRPVRPAHPCSSPSTSTRASPCRSSATHRYP
ncbi:helix-turn-helix domain-containing protein [Nonomuraea sp. NPDC049695]|uniref:helix-turn-helix domain-containing protein n=1 Tax=Nonomuraea sp. NPDC049695 TaxID=3154734 RepID=UPI00343D9BE6